VEDALVALQPGLQGMEIDTSVFRPATFIETAIANIGTLLLIGFVLVILVLLAFYFQWRTALISLVAIPLSVITAIMVLYLTDATFNMMILAGMVAALGIVIDDAIIDVEHISQRLNQRRQEGSDKSTTAIIIEAILEMRNPLGYALVIILLAVLPILFLPGLLGSMIQPLAVSYIVAMISSLLVALIVTPALCMSLLSIESQRRDSPIVQGLHRFYNKLLARTVRSPYVALIVAGVFIAIGLIAVLFLDVSMLPSLKQTNLLIEFEAIPGTSRPEMNRIIAQASSELGAIPGVRNIGSQVGRAITGDAVVGINSGEIWVSLDPAVDYVSTVAAVQDIVDGYPGLRREVQTLQPEPIGQTLASADKDIAVRIYGWDLDLLADKAHEVSLALEEVDGIVDAQANTYASEPQVEIEVDLAAAEQHGIKPGDIRRQATTLLSGIHVGNLYEEQKVFDVLVWGMPELRSNLTNIRQLLIDTPDASQVALGDLADVRIAPAATVIERDAVSRYVDVSASVSGRRIDSVAADIEDRLQAIQLPFEYHMEVLSDSQGLQANQQRLIGIAVAVLIGIYLVMQAALSSWRLALVAFLTTPTALVGGLLAALILGSSLSIGALFGLFTVLAIAVRNGIVLLRHYQHLEQVEGESFGPELTIRGASERLGPILMTALATGAALLPLMIGGNRAGTEMLGPMSAVILGGLVTSTLLNLFIIPPLYLRYGYSVPPEKPPVGLEEGVAA
jgi:Cu/Ag efflux pump CusA